MRFKYLFLFVMLLVLTSAVAAASDEIGILDEKIFTVPENFTIMNQTGQDAFLENEDGSQSFVIMVLPSSFSTDELLGAYEQMGYDFNQTYYSYQRALYHVSEYSFTYENYTGLFFVCENGNDRILVTHGFLDEDDMPEGKDMVSLNLIGSFQDNF